MTDKNDAEKSAEQTLITLDQLSQTLEVMTCVVDRLKQHLTRQVSLTTDLFQNEQRTVAAEREACVEGSRLLQNESYIVEITQQEVEEGYDPETVH